MIQIPTHLPSDRKISHEENIYIDTYNLRPSNRYYYFALNSTIFISQYRGLSLMAENKLVAFFKSLERTKMEVSPYIKED